MTVNTEIRALADRELDKVSGGLDPLSILVGAVVTGGAHLIAHAAYNGAFNSVVQWKDGKPVGLGVPQ